MSAAARIAAQTAAAQGVPVKIEDPVALAKLAVLLDAEPPKAKPRRQEVAA